MAEGRTTLFLLLGALVGVVMPSPVPAPHLNEVVRGDSPLHNTLARLDNLLERRSEYNDVMEESGEEDDALSRVLYQLQEGELDGNTDLASKVMTRLLGALRRAEGEDVIRSRVTRMAKRSRSRESGRSKEKKCKRQRNRNRGRRPRPSKERRRPSRERRPRPSQERCVDDVTTSTTTTATTRRTSTTTTPSTNTTTTARTTTSSTTPSTARTTTTTTTPTSNSTSTTAATTTTTRRTTPAL